MNRIVIKCRSGVDTYTPKQVTAGVPFLDGADCFEMLAGALDPFFYGDRGVVPELAARFFDAEVVVRAHVADGEAREAVLCIETRTPSIHSSEES